MSVTFFIEGNTTGQWRAECHESGTVWVDWSPGLLKLKAASHRTKCEECSAYGIHPYPVLDVSDELDVNLANQNARMVLDRLGLSEGGELCGTVPADVFLGAVMLAMSSDRDDSGIPAYDISGGYGPRMIDCGLPAGYFTQTFERLHNLATEAVRLGRNVVFS